MISKSILDPILKNDALRISIYVWKMLQKYVAPTRSKTTSNVAKCSRNIKCCNLHEPEKLKKRNLKPYTDDVNQNEISGTV